MPGLASKNPIKKKLPGDSLEQIILAGPGLLENLEIRGIVSEDYTPVERAEVVCVFEGAQELREVDGIRAQGTEVLA